MLASACEVGCETGAEAADETPGAGMHWHCYTHNSFQSCRATLPTGLKRCFRNFGEWGAGLPLPPPQSWLQGGDPRPSPWWTHYSTTSCSLCWGMGVGLQLTSQKPSLSTWLYPSHSPAEPAPPTSSPSCPLTTPQRDWWAALCQDWALGGETSQGEEFLGCSERALGPVTHQSLPVPLVLGQDSLSPMLPVEWTPPGPAPPNYQEAGSGCIGLCAPHP